MERAKKIKGIWGYSDYFALLIGQRAPRNALRLVPFATSYTLLRMSGPPT